jgi:hypothetical protein
VGAVPAADTRTWVSSLFAGPFGLLESRDLGPPPAVRAFGHREVWMRCRGLLSRYGGFVPCEVAYPARSLTHVRVPAAGITLIARPSSRVSAR